MAAHWNAEVAKWNVDRLRTWQKSAAKTDMGVIDSVEIVDDSTINLKLKGAPAGILYRLGDAISQRSYMVSKAVIDKEGDDGLARKMVGSGSMTFVDWVSGDRMNLKKWDKAWEKGVDGQPMPYIDAAVLRIIREETVGITEMRTGNLDVYGQAEPRSYASVRANPDLELVLFSWLGNVNYLVFNTQKPPFDNIKLRQAAMHALDREAINKGVSQGTGTTAYYYWGPNDLGSDQSLPKLAYDVNKAKQLVAEAGHPNGLDIMHDFYQLELLQRTAEALKQSWDAVGMRATLTGVERTAFVSKLQVSNFQSANSWRQWGESDPEAYSSPSDQRRGLQFRPVLRPGDGQVYGGGPDSGRGCQAGRGLQEVPAHPHRKGALRGDLVQPLRHRGEQEAQGVGAALVQPREDPRRLVRQVEQTT